MKSLRFISLVTFAAAISIIPAYGGADEATALKVLASADSSLNDKALACDELGRVGTAKAVPVLAKLLADEKLHDYARDGLERIEDPAASKALLASLKDLKGSQRVGVIITLGDRGEKKAVKRLANIAKGKNEEAAGAALSALGQIATDEAGEAILAVLVDADDARKKSAAQAALLAAQRMKKAGNKESAAKLQKAAVDAGAIAPLPSRK